MSSFVYLVRIGDIYRIGYAKNLEKKFRSILPDEVVATLQIDNADIFIARLLRRFKKSRIPDTDYLRLTDNDLIQCHKFFSSDTKLASGIGNEFSIAFSASLLLLFLVFHCLILFDLSWQVSLSLSFMISSIPPLYLFLFGNFGGYNSTDLPFFVSWNNRLKSLMLTLLFIFLSYQFFHIFIS